jgi:hypothetical protein
MYAKLHYFMPIRWNSSSEHVHRLALSSILNLCTAKSRDLSIGKCAANLEHVAQRVGRVQDAQEGHRAPVAVAGRADAVGVVEAAVLRERLRGTTQAKRLAGAPEEFSLPQKLDP